MQDDPDCRKGLTCTAKCLGDNSCITGCFAKYGNPNLDNLLKCTIEDHECIKVAILEGGADKFGEEPQSPAPTVQSFDLKSMEGTWYKVAGYNPNYDCYACQRNTFSSPQHTGEKDTGGSSVGGLLGAMMASINGGPADRLQVDVEFSMPRLLEDGSPPPPSGVRETFVANANAADSIAANTGLQSVGYNQYSTHETMVFDTATNNIGDSIVDNIMKLGNKGEEKLYSRTAHSEGEMFGLSELTFIWFVYFVLYNSTLPTRQLTLFSLSLSCYRSIVQNSGKIGTLLAKTIPIKMNSNSFTTMARHVRTPMMVPLFTAARAT